MAARAGFRALVVARTPALTRSAYLLTGDWGNAQDLVQGQPAATHSPPGYTSTTVTGPHTAIGDPAPTTRLTNLPGQYS
jgi:hypothetical protein